MNELGIAKISPSAITCYMNCPKLFFYTCWLGLKLPQVTVHLDFGTAIHEAIDVLYGNRNKDGTWANEDSVVNAMMVFNKRFTREVCNSQEEYLTMAADGCEIIKAYWQEKDVLLAKGIDPIEFEIPGREVMVHPETKEPWPVPLSYRIDAYLKNNAVGEFKTSSSRYDPFEVRSRPQSLCYVLAYYKKFGIIPVLHYVVMLKKKKKDRIQHLSFVYDMADLLAFDSEMRAMFEKIKNREFDRPSRGHSKWCDCIKIENALTY